MKLVVGLGNPGPRYRGTRHNVGFEVARTLAEREDIALDRERFEGWFGRGRTRGGAPLDVGILLPGTFMNLSGRSVAEALRRLPVEDPASDICIVLDDADLPLGRLRLRPGGSAGGHRGLEDILDRLGTRDVPRLRVGIGRPELPMATADFVLGRFDEEERRSLVPVLERAADAALCLFREGVGVAMNLYNGRC